MIEIIVVDEHNSQTHHRKIKELETRDLKDKSVPSQCFDVSENEESDENIQPNKKKFKKSNVLNFEIELASEEWNSICPQMKTKKDGTEAKYLQKGWTDIMRDKIYEKEKLPCTFSFSTNQINPGTFYAEMKGKCTSENCKSKVTVICRDIPEKDKPVLFEVETNDTKKRPHLKNVRLQGKAREIVKKELENIKPKQWRRRRARLMNFGDPEPANLFTLPVLQKAKQQQKNEKLGIPVGIPLFESIENLRGERLTNDFISKIQTDISKLLEKEKNEFSQKNDYYMPEFTENLSKLCREFPCWTMVMNEHFNNPLSPASSARSEAYFSDFKSGIDGESRVDKVLVDHCWAIEADCNLAKNAIQNLKPEECTTRELNYELNETKDNYLYDVDSWRNKACKIEKEIPLDEEENKPTHVLHMTNVLNASSFIQTVDEKTKLIKNQLKPRGQHVTPCTDLNFLQKPRNIKKKRGKGILRNGNGLSAVLVDDVKLYFKQTCAFDSISELLSYAYCEFESFHSFGNANLPKADDVDKNEQNTKCKMQILIT
ncbi:hypothetical protein TKK_0015289 [Trichogramma kaykai]